MVPLSRTCLSLGVLHTTASARNLNVPFFSGYQSQQAIGTDGEIDLGPTNFLGLTTYANLAYVHCLAPEDENVETYDIAILGAPFDTVSPCSIPEGQGTSRGNSSWNSNVLRRCM